MLFEIGGLLIFGFVVGGYGTLVGIGGGPLIVPLLMICYKFVPVDIIATSLMVILFNVLSGSYSYYRQGRIDLISGTKFGIAAIPGALLGTLITRYFTIDFLKILFGFLLLGLGVYVFATAIQGTSLKYRENKAGVRDGTDDGNRSPGKTAGQKFGRPEQLTKRVIFDSQGVKYVYRFDERLGMIISAIIGFVGPLVGVGGGVFHVPAMTEILKFPTHVATATVHYVLLICVFFALIPYITMGAVHYAVAVPMGIGTVFGARLGARLSQQYNSRKLFKLLSLILFILSIQLLFFR
jgi:uncharacterized membrane protein YfcA